MSTPVLEPGPEPKPHGPGIAARVLRGLGLVVLIAAISFGAAYLVLELRMGAQQALSASQVSALRDETSAENAALRAELDSLRTELSSRTESLQTEVKRVEEAAKQAGVLLEQNGELTSLESRLAEIETLKLDLRKTQQEMDEKLKALEESVKEQVATSEEETAAALSLEMAVKSQLIKAQGEVLLTQMYWAEGNRGLARDEITIAHETLMKALEEAPEAEKADVKKLVEKAEATKAALILDSTSARDQLNLLWHEVSDLLGK